MFWVTRIFELLSATKKLNDAKPHVMNALSGLTVVLLLAIFGALLAALMLTAMLCLVYWQIIMAGGTVIVAALVTAIMTLAILLTALLGASAAFRRTRSAVDHVVHSQAPIVAPVVNKVTDVAGAFWSGLRAAQRTPHGALREPKEKKASRAHR